MSHCGYLYQPAEILVFGEKNPILVPRQAHDRLIRRGRRQLVNGGNIVTRGPHGTHKTKIETLVGQDVHARIPGKCLVRLIRMFKRQCLSRVSERRAYMVAGKPGMGCDQVWLGRTLGQLA